MSEYDSKTAALVAELTKAGVNFIELGATKEAFLTAYKQGFPDIAPEVWARVESRLERLGM